MPLQRKPSLETISEGWQDVEPGNTATSSSLSEVDSTSSASSEGPTFEHIEDIATHAGTDSEHDHGHGLTESQEHDGVVRNHVAGSALTGHGSGSDSVRPALSDLSVGGPTSNLSSSSVAAPGSVDGSATGPEPASASLVGPEAGPASSVGPIVSASALNGNVRPQIGYGHQKHKIPFFSGRRPLACLMHSIKPQPASKEEWKAAYLKLVAERDQGHDDVIQRLKEVAAEQKAEEQSQIHPNEKSLESPRQLSARPNNVTLPGASASNENDSGSIIPFSELCHDCRMARLSAINDESDVQSSVADPGSPVPSAVSGAFIDDEDLSIAALTVSGLLAEYCADNARDTDQSTDGGAVQEQSDARSVSALGGNDVTEPAQHAAITVSPLSATATAAGGVVSTTASADSTVRTESYVQHNLADHHNNAKHTENSEVRGHITVTYDKASGEERALDIVEYDHDHESNDTTDSTHSNNDAVDAIATVDNEFPCVSNTNVDRDHEYEADDESTDGALLVDVDAPGVSPVSGSVISVATAGTTGSGYEADDNES